MKKNDEFGFGHLEFQMVVGHPSGDVHWRFFKNMSLELQGDVKEGDGDLETTSIWKMVKIIRGDEITYRGNI